MPLFFCPVRKKQKDSSLWTRKKVPSLDSEYRDTLILDFPASRTVRWKRFLFEPHSLGIFVVALWVDWNNRWVPGPKMGESQMLGKLRATLQKEFTSAETEVTSRKWGGSICDVPEELCVHVYACTFWPPKRAFWGSERRIIKMSWDKYIFRTSLCQALGIEYDTNLVSLLKNLQGRYILNKYTHAGLYQDS